MANRTLIPFVSLLLATACATPRENTATPAPEECYACHGSRENGNPAPPPIPARPEAPPDAHQSHLHAADWHAAVPCATCHPVPTHVSDPQHIDNQVQVTLDGIASDQGAKPSYDAATHTCNGTYCHGTTLTGGRLTTPQWFAVGPDQHQAACGTCHRTSWFPAEPGQVHPPRNDCHSCHGAVVDASLKFVNPALHVNGTIDVTNITCNLCHGNAAGDPTVDRNWAPPVDAEGRSDRTEMTVGAHQPHLAPSTTHAQVPCAACHLVPIDVTSPGHIDGQPTVLYSFPATANGAPTAFDAQAGTCANWCHGSGFKSPNLASPAWNVVPSGALPCNTCHGYPPVAPHPQRTDCVYCHKATTGPSHINGAVDLKTACNACHGNATGDATNPIEWAPPVDAEGRSDTALPSVGAHQLHMDGGAWHRPVVCSDCHTVPASVTSPGHVDDQVLLTWGEVPSHGTTPSFDTTNNTCSGVYCHGATLIQQGQEVTPTWTASGGAFPSATCGAVCHGFPPAAPHPQDTSCGTCHSSVIGTSGFVAPALHINGGVDF